MAGLWGGWQTPEVEPGFQVEDIEAAVERARAGGGQAEEPKARP